MSRGSCTENPRRPAWSRNPNKREPNMKTQQNQESGRFYAIWKQETIDWVRQYLGNHPYKRGVVAAMRAILKHSTPVLLVDALGRETSSSQFDHLARNVWDKMVSPESAKDVSRVRRLVPVDAHAIVSENNELRKAVENSKDIMGAVCGILRKVGVLADHATFDPPQPAAEAREELIALSDLIKNK